MYSTKSGPSDPAIPFHSPHDVAPSCTLLPIPGSSHP